MPIQITDGERNLKLDAGRGLPSIEWDHHKIHDGSTYRASHHEETANGNSVEVTITTPNDKKCHLQFHGFSSGSSEINFYEDVEVTANTGNEISVYNADRTSTNETEAAVVEGATINTDNAALIANTVVGSAGGFFTADYPGYHDTRHEWILKPGKSYTVQITNTTGDAAELHANLDWYEVPL